MKSFVDEPATLKLTQDLVRIDSVNPSLVPGAKGEKEIAEHLAEWMRGLGLKVELREVAKGRWNAVGVLKGQGGGPRLMLNGHTDTVGYDYMTDPPLDPVIKGNRMYGRGVLDMKSGLAASLAAVKAVVDSGAKLKGDVVVACVCDEEYASIGTEDAAERYPVDAAIVGEPTGLDIVRCHKGFAWIDVETRGLAAHGSAWDMGVDAIVKMGGVLKGLEALNSELNRKSHPLTGSASLHASIIKGGLELSTYPDECKLSIERRLIPGESRETVAAEMERLLSRIAEADSQFKASYEITFYRGSMDVPEDAEIIKTLLDCSEKTLGYKPQFVGAGGWLDTQILWERGTPAVSFGPSGDGAHAAVEWIELDSVYKAARVQEQAIRRFCGVA